MFYSKINQPKLRLLVYHTESAIEKHLEDILIPYMIYSAPPNVVTQLDNVMHNVQTTY
jgi:hypothetical protein